ncbi:MAG: hypothetical protein AB7T08_06300 [Hyphomonadaceae bacterium]
MPDTEYAVRRLKLRRADWFAVCAVALIAALALGFFAAGGAS